MLSANPISGVIFSNQKTEFSAHFTPNVTYAHRETGDLQMHIMTPARPNITPKHSHPLYEKMRKDPKASQWQPKEETRRFPLIIDVPGSGWSGSDGYAHIPWMSDFAKAGYVTASISYRGTFKDDVRFPAAVQDTLEAIRFLRAHADEYLVDTGRIALLGDSSGGHTAAMAALSEKHPDWIIGENTDQSQEVMAAVIFYGPNDLNKLLEDRRAEGKKLRPGEDTVPFEAREIWQDDFLEDPQEYLAKASPINYIQEEMKLPKFLFLNGDEDPIIPLAQGIRFCEKIREYGGKADFYKIIGAGHTTGCWTKESMELIRKFLDAVL